MTGAGGELNWDVLKSKIELTPLLPPLEGEGDLNRLMDRGENELAYPFRIMGGVRKPRLRT